MKATLGPVVEFEVVEMQCLPFLFGPGDLLLKGQPARAGGQERPYQLSETCLYC
jgi:hypothetical protein